MSLDADVRRLASVRPFTALPREALQMLAFSCAKRRLQSGERLFSAGDPAEGAFFVLEGEIVLNRGSARSGAPESAPSSANRRCWSRRFAPPTPPPPSTACC